MSDSTPGFAVRRKNTCGFLIPCNMTVDPFFAYCSEGTECLRKANTLVCSTSASGFPALPFHLPTTNQDKSNT